MSGVVKSSLWLGFSIMFFALDITTGRIGWAVAWCVLAILNAILLGIEIESRPPKRTYTYDVLGGVLRISGDRVTQAEADAIRAAFARGDS